MCETQILSANSFHDVPNDMWSGLVTNDVKSDNNWLLNIHSSSCLSNFSYSAICLIFLLFCDGFLNSKHYFSYVNPTNWNICRTLGPFIKIK